MNWGDWAKLGATAAVAIGGAAAGAAAGFTAERVVIARAQRAPDPHAEEAFGSLRATPQIIAADDGVELHAEVDEPSTSPGEAAEGADDVTVIFCHGYCNNLDVWHFQRRDLVDSARLAFFDMRSHGRSGRSPAEQVSLTQLALDLATVIDALAPVGRVIVVGHSLGGMTVQALARVRPDLFGTRILGAALIATSSGAMDELAILFPGAPGRAVHRIAPAVLGVASRQPGIVENARRRASDFGYLITQRYSFGGPVPPSLVEFAADLVAATPIEVVTHFMPILDDLDETTSLAAFRRIPTLVIGCERDWLTPVEHSRIIAEELPTATYVEFADAGHMVVLERHEDVTSELAKLIERVRND